MKTIIILVLKSYEPPHNTTYSQWRAKQVANHNFQG